MMQKEYLKYLISESKKFVNKNNVFDIILYGSAVKGKENARDIDILMIFDNKSLKERTDKAHLFKKIIYKDLEIDIKTINIQELFEGNFLARQSIFTEGYSLKHQESFSRRLGFIGYSIFTYKLISMDHNKKTRFTYSLIGRKNEEGILKKIGAVALGRGAFKVPIENSKTFEEFLEKWGVEYNFENALIPLV